MRKASAPDEPLFVNTRGGRITRSGVSWIVRRTAKRADLEPEYTPRMTPHVIRHTTAMHLLEADVDITTVAAWMGHASLGTTNEYVQITLRMKQAALAKLEQPAALDEARYPDDELLAWLDRLCGPLGWRQRPEFCRAMTWVGSCLPVMIVHDELTLGPGARMFIGNAIRTLARAANHLLPDRTTTTQGLAVGVETIDLHRATPAQLGCVRARLARFMATCFAPAHEDDDPDAQHFSARYAWRVTDPEVYGVYCTARFIQVDGRDAAVVHAYVRDVELDGRPIEVMGGAMVVYPEFRGHHLVNLGTNRFVADYLARAFRDGQERYFLGHVFSPESYAYITTRSACAYPTPARPDDPHMEAVLQLALPERSPNGVHREPFRSLRSGRKGPRRHSPEVGMYLERNPRFADGFSLPVLIRLGGWDVVRTVVRMAHIDGRRRLSGRRARRRLSTDVAGSQAHQSHLN